MRILNLILCVMITLASGGSLVSADELRFVAGEIPPYVFLKSGKPDGAAAVIVSELAASLGEPFKLDFLPWSRAQSEVQEKDNLGIIPLSRNPEREPIYKWVGPIVADSQVLVTKASFKKPPKTIEEARDMTIGTLRGSPGEALLRAQGFKRLVDSADEATNAKLLDAERIDAWLVARLVAPFQYRLLNFDPAMLAYGAEVRRNDIYLGLSKNTPDATVKKWQSALDVLQAKGRIAEIIKSFE